MYTRGAYRTLGCGWIWWWSNRVTSGRARLWISSFWQWPWISLHPWGWWSHTAFLWMLPNPWTLPWRLKCIKPGILLMRMVCRKLHDISTDYKVNNKGVSIILPLITFSSVMEATSMGFLYSLTHLFCKIHLIISEFCHQLNTKCNTHKQHPVFL